MIYTFSNLLNQSTQTYAVHIVHVAAICNPNMQVMHSFKSRLKCSDKVSIQTSIQTQTGRENVFSIEVNHEPTQKRKYCDKTEALQAPVLSRIPVSSTAAFVDEGVFAQCERAYLSIHRRFDQSWYPEKRTLLFSSSTMRRGKGLNSCVTCFRRVQDRRCAWSVADAESGVRYTRTTSTVPKTYWSTA
jgi:hypothetical protein